jgi:hypothetical protein
MNPGSTKFPLSALFVALSLLLSPRCPAQDVRSTGDSSKVTVAAGNPSTIETIPLTVPKGTAVQVLLDKELKIQKVGQSVHGRVAEPIYAFDKLVVPVGT